MSATTPTMPAPPANNPPRTGTAPSKHRLHEDIQALLTGTLFVGMGVVLFNHVGLLSGGTAGLAFLLHYATGVSFSVWFFLINLPFYWLAWRRMGPAFTVKTFAAVGLLSIWAYLVPRWISIGDLAPGFAAVAGGLLVGAGMLMLFRHRASLGGFNVMVLYLQERFGWRAGHVQMALDCAIVLTAFALREPSQIAWSVLGAVVLNMTLAINHRPGRYMAV